MEKLLLVVEDAFEVRGRGVIVVPDIPLDELKQPTPTMVMLKRPDGTSSSVEAWIGVPFIDPPLVVGKRGYTCFLKGIDRLAVPIGTEVYAKV